MHYSLKQFMLTVMGFGTLIGVIAHFFSYKWILILTAACLAGSITYLLLVRMRVNIALSGAACVAACGVGGFICGVILFPPIHRESPNPTVFATLSTSIGALLWVVLARNSPALPQSPITFMKLAFGLLLLGVVLGLFAGIYFVGRHSSTIHVQDVVPFVLLWVAGSSVAALPFLLMSFWQLWMRLSVSKTHPRGKC
jgi:hypothetical protein